MSICDIEGRSAKLQRPLLAAQVKNLAQSYVLRELVRIADSRNYRAYVARHSVSRLDECGFVEIRASWVLGIPVGIIQRLSRDISAPRGARAEQVLGACDTDRCPALVMMYRRNPPAAHHCVEKRIHVPTESLP